MGRSFPGDEPLGDANRNVLGMFLEKDVCWEEGESEMIALRERFPDGVAWRVFQSRI